MSYFVKHEIVKSRWSSDRNPALKTLLWNNLSKSKPGLDELNLMFQGQNTYNLFKLRKRNIILGLTFCYAAGNKLF